jgi:ribosomal protein L37AE/L43A
MNGFYGVQWFDHECASCHREEICRQADDGRWLCVDCQPRPVRPATSFLDFDAVYADMCADDYPGAAYPCHPAVCPLCPGTPWPDDPDCPVCGGTGAVRLRADGTTREAKQRVEALRRQLAGEGV